MFHGSIVALVTPFAGDRVDAGVFLRTAQGARDSAAMALDDYTVMDANVSYRPSAGFELFARIENALAERYSEVPTYRTPGRTVYAGLRYRFGRETTR